MWLCWQSVWSPPSSRQKVVAGGMWAVISPETCLPIAPWVHSWSSQVPICVSAGNFGRLFQKWENDWNDCRGGVSGHDNPCMSGKNNGGTQGKCSNQQRSFENRFVWNRLNSDAKAWRDIFTEGFSQIRICYCFTFDMKWVAVCHWEPLPLSRLVSHKEKN